ncbi:MAG: DNA-binding protein YbiB [Proteobacteria bacterium]|nr:DNA-binding protein YbiB [Pseudomonadota bacterium]
MSIAAYLREIGRGKDGARSLTRAQAHDLMCQVLDGRVSDLEVGGFALAMRIKGESAAELEGFLDAVHERSVALVADRPWVVLPSYNGARRLPNLTPLLALLLAQEGVPVLVHGPLQDPARVTSADIFRDLGLPFANDASDVAHAWARHEPVFMRTEALCPALARLLDVRRVVGLRNSGHTVAKLLAPGSTALRVVNYTHPEYASLLGEFLPRIAAHALLMRGTEGEPVADPRRFPRLEVYVGGVSRPDLSRAAQEGVLTELPVLPLGRDAATTAVYIQAVVSGEKPAPTPIARQVECMVQTLTALATASAQERFA